MRDDGFGGRAGDDLRRRGQALGFQTGLERPQVGASFGPFLFLHLLQVNPVLGVQVVGQGQRVGDVQEGDGGVQALGKGFDGREDLLGNLGAI